MYFKQAMRSVFFNTGGPMMQGVGLSKVTIVSPGENEVSNNGLLLFLKLYEHCMTLNIDDFFLSRSLRSVD